MVDMTIVPPTVEWVDIDGGRFGHGRVPAAVEIECEGGVNPEVRGPGVSLTAVR
jgi:hypothetical protein